jgi:hypothetical protein
VGSDSTCRSACRHAKYTEEVTAFGGLDTVAAVTGKASEPSEMARGGKRHGRLSGAQALGSFGEY